MIINQDNSLTVPEKTIAFFPLIKKEGEKPFNLDKVNLFLKPLNINNKRDWFTSHFYKCLPLAIGNMQGFVFSLPYTVNILWNGNNTPGDVFIEYGDDFEPYKNFDSIYLTNEFGNGIITIHFPLTLKTPPGVNLMTIAPPNFPLPGLSPMTGVVESDNIRFTFTVNIKIDFPNTMITILPNYPLMGIIPIPRYFCDSFELKSAHDIFDKKIIEEELRIVKKHSEKREFGNKNKLKSDKIYYLGGDVEGNKFKDHQLPKKNKN
jgi:hypothetical protein